MHLIAEGLDASVEGVERQGPDAIGPLAQPLCGDERPDAVGAHELRAVEQRQTLLRLEFKGFPAQFAEQVGCGAHYPADLDLAQSQQRQAHVGQRRQVSRCAERSLLVDDRQDVAVEELDEPLDGPKLYARVTVGERLDLEQQDEPHDLRRHALAGAAGVRHDEVALQPGEFVAADRDVAQRAEARRDAVDRPLGVLHLAVEVFAAADDPLPGVVAQSQRKAAFEDFAHAGDGQALRGYQMMFHIG